MPESLNGLSEEQRFIFTLTMRGWFMQLRELAPPVGERRLRLCWDVLFQLSIRCGRTRWPLRLARYFSRSLQLHPSAELRPHNPRPRYPHLRTEIPSVSYTWRHFANQHLRR